MEITSSDNSQFNSLQDSKKGQLKKIRIVKKLRKGAHDQTPTNDSLKRLL